jgi:hypothetical protein
MIEVRVIEFQQEEIKEIPMANSEREMYLQRYLSGQPVNDLPQSQSNMTMEDMFRQWDMENARQSMPQQNNNRPGEETVWTQMDLGNGESLGIKINIVSDF